MKKICAYVLYFLPFAVSIFFYGAIAISVSLNSIDQIAWVFCFLLFASAVLMLKGRWYGCVCGFIVGGILIYMGNQYTGQVISESLVGIIFCAYFAVCGFVCFKLSNK